ncbi:MAG: WYL domain-containing protein [Oscillospiraceae bacterium]|nr:WYL domain-containing protein [Oscillospiraceae bacterium]
MMIQIPQAVQEEKGLLLLMILDILAEETDAAHHMKKGRLRERIEERYGFKPSRNTLYGKLEIMRLAGISVVQEEDGLYYDADHLTDGELRYLVDSVLYSDFVTPKGAEGIIESLAKLGSPIFHKYVERQKARIKHTRKNKQQGIFATIEDVQSAIFRRHQLRFNEVYYDRDLKPKRKHQTYLTVNPYEMVCKNGRYYLIGAEEGAEEMRTWRLDRICDVAVLETPRVEIRQYLDVMASGGMSIYADAQPELCGGTIENFKLQVSDMAVDEIVDVFGTDFKILHDGKTGPDVIRISVRTTRESVRSWALIHASKVVILEPLDLRDEIKDQLWHSAQQYQIANRSVRLRSRYADTLQEAVRMA